jgi:hypothetical protein
MAVPGKGTRTPRVLKKSVIGASVRIRSSVAPSSAGPSFGKPNMKLTMVVMPASFAAATAARTCSGLLTLLHQA